MLRIQFSNRIEALCDAVVGAIGAVPDSPFSAQQIVVPSTAMRRHLTLAIARRHGICANVDCVYLAEWLWQQIARVVRTVAVESPFAASALEWRVYQILQESTWAHFPRLANYLKEPSDAMRFELAGEIAALFEQYITYRQDWMRAWQRGDGIPMPKASAAQIDDQAWQAELWRRISGQLGAAPEHPATVFLRSLERAETTGANTFGLPETVHVFCLPAMPPLYLAVLVGLARWVDVTLYVLNPCREYWFDIVDPKRLRALTLRGAATHHDTGNGLLASWGKQTKAHIELLLAQAGDAPLDDEGFEESFPNNRLGRVQHAIFTLTELAPASLTLDPTDRSIEVHVCHSLTRELEVLQDQLLALFAGPSPPRPEEILIVTPDLDTAAPLIEAVFGNVPAERRLPYAITGRGHSAVNAAARALLALLAILPSRFPASALVELLQQPLIGRRFGIGAEELSVVENWLHESGIRWALDAEHRQELNVPGIERFTIADGLDRLFLGYAFPQHVSAPAFGRIPAGNPEGSQAEILGAFAEFIEQLTALRADLREPRLPAAWLEALLALLDSFLAPTSDDLEDLTEVRATLRELHENMRRGGLAIPVPLAVLRTSLESLFDDAARGGVPTGSITFSSLSSLRNLPFKFIGIVGLDDGAFPAAARPREFDLMTAEPRAGDRQRRLDDRNLFLDLLLAARERLYLSYTGRSIRDNSVRPPSVVLAELIETLLPALAPEPGDTQALAKARRRLIVEHPLQAFAESYFRGDDPRLRSFNRELCEARRHALTHPDPASVPPVLASVDAASAADAGSVAPDAAAARAAANAAGTAAADDDDDDDQDDDASSTRGATRFFTAPLAVPGPEWRRVSLDQLLQFFRNPCHFLLKQRLGMSLYREEGTVSDEEPFTPDYKSREALAERLLPAAMQAATDEALTRLAQAGIEYPPGALGSTALKDERASLQRFALEVRNATQAPRLPPLTVDLPFVLQGEDWVLATMITERREAGLVLHRYDDTRTSDYLAAWLTHLVAAAASPTPIGTRWISRDGSFRFTPCSDARSILERLLELYRRGLREPIHFFPKSAWAYIQGGGNLTKARSEWHRTFGSVKGEDKHEAYRLALRGVSDPLDADFESCANTVFGPSVAYLDDPRL
jgi:exodeoxyribonuclease V gamma subunit